MFKLKTTGGVISSNTIKDNFQLLEDYVNEKLAKIQTSSGQDNAYKEDLNMNNKNIINLNDLAVNSLTVAGVSTAELLAEMEQDVRLVSGYREDIQGWYEELEELLDDKSGNSVKLKVSPVTFDAAPNSKPVFVESFGVYFANDQFSEKTLRSVDGSVWTISSYSGYIYIEYIPDFGVIVKVDEKGRMSYSEDGLSFTDSTPSGFTTSSNAFLHTVYVAGDGLYYMSIGNGTLAKTTDGKVWTTLSHTGISLALGTSLSHRFVDYSVQQGLFIVVINNRVYYSPDFQNWQLQPSSFYILNFSCLDETTGSLTLFGQKFGALGLEPKMQTLFNGTLTDVDPSNPPPNGSKQCVYDPSIGLYLTIGDSPLSIGYSRDTTNWVVKPAGSGFVSVITTSIMNPHSAGYFVFAQELSLSYRVNTIFDVVLESGAERTSFRPTSSLSSSNVQDAIEELDANKETPLGAQTKVDTHANKINNPHSVTKNQVGLGNVSNFGVANESSAKGMTDTNYYVTPLGVGQAIGTIALGVGQTWQNVKSLRLVDGATHTNDTGRPIQLHISGGRGSSSVPTFRVNGEVFSRYSGTEPDEVVINIIIPAGNTYSLTNLPDAEFYWWELR